MSDKKISQFSSGGLVQDTDTIAGVRAGANTKVNFGTAAALDFGLGVDDVPKNSDLGSGAYADLQLRIVDESDDYTLVLADGLNTLVRLNKSSEVFLEVPDEGDVDFPIGTSIALEQVGIGKVTLSFGSSVTINTPETYSTGKQYAQACITKVGADEWTLAGLLEAA